MASISYHEQGKGPTLLLLHGFPFHQEIWQDIIQPLAKSLHVVTIDLPGFGKSPLLKASFSIDDVAREIVVWMSEKGIKRPVVAGHSLGGYVALSMAHQFPETVSALVLLHSTAVADNEEKKKSRDKALEFISSNGVKAFTSNFIKPLFSNPEHPAIEKVKRISSQASEEAVSGYVKAMRDRSDRTSVLKTFPRPVLIVGGEKDPGIPVDSLEEQKNLNPEISLHILKDTAHMGMYEQPVKTAEILAGFANKNSKA